MLQELSRCADPLDASRVNQPIETVLFDFGGTLDANGVAWKERFYALYSADGVDVSPEAFQSCFFAADDPLVGGLPMHTDLAGTVHALAANLETELVRRGVACINASRGERVASQFISDTAATIERNRPVLEALAKRYRLGIVSNFYGNLEAVCRSVGLGTHFSVFVDSHRVGAEKPDPAIFRAALDALRGTAETTVFVGDSLPRDGEGARRAGMRFIWLRPEAAAEVPAALRIDHTVTDLRNLTTVLA